ncbi:MULTISPECIES: outer membrane protein assembly factor BamC [Variovorax]|uniref:Outer membrane protein assembly factor BamC n=1 Tax=Variovorax ginsengisoli TaxID=363844 RepID=A0ABT8S394_9BURK|nr:MULTISPECIES: outer membrane protein assembly factor BamC [Variovorax]MDM0069422.1 outer membrane protein assembly factor BamC [Variovorax sp. J31P207]MDN8613798.1 outer membrane protein assembly factor BamC [Variovorax ginsengisoli]MDO1532968.1 outer membrane protein assembly factor BamC [Variovorax ginsengisoli]
MKTISRFALLALVAGLAACSALESEKIDYKSAGKAPTLEVPPDLTQLSRDNRYAVPGGAVTANSYQAGLANAPSLPTAVSSVGDVKMERAGTQRWLVINRPADQLWEPVRDFWQESGFLLTTDQRNLGIMETDWAENRAKLPQDIIRGTIGKLMDSLYSTGELDRFRTRLERTPNGTEIFISHRGMEEVYSSSRKDQTVWQPRASDPELEAEFLRRLMVKLGVSQEQSKVIAAAGAAPQTAKVANVGGQPMVQINDNFERAWRRVGLALDRTGFTVEDRDRTAGTYFVRYVPPNPNKSDPSFFSKLFSSGKTEAPLKFRILVKGQGETSTVSVLNEAGAPDSTANAQRIVQVIADDLK